jgi:tRNA A-37 threonylcarbamoyl transferase component Bud32
MTEGGGSRRKPGPDTSGALAIARTVPSDARLDVVASADTVLAEGAGGGADTPSNPSQRGDVLGGRYRILAEMGRGAEGVVYRARDLKADTVVALKLLQHDEGADERLQRFRRELQMARKVTHPNVVRIYDLVELPGRFGLSMEVVDGEALDVRIARGPLTRDEMVRLAHDLARALAAAHEAGVTHRDLKPANVLVRKRDGSAVVTDFGVSRVHADRDARVSSQPDPASPRPVELTREGAIVGTPLYMAPEQLEGHADAGPAADVYAYGAVLHEAATGAALHEADTVGELLRLRKAAPAPPLHGARPDLPAWLCDMVDRSLRRDPGERFPSGVELLAAIDPARRTPRGTHFAWVASAGAVVVAATAGALLVATHHALPPAASAAAGAPSPAPPTTPPLTFSVANVTRITFGDACEEFPALTPDGTSVVYDGTVGRDSFLYELDLAPGSTPRQLTHVRGWDIAASVSPDGSQVAFVRFVGDQEGAWVGPLDGSAPPHLVAKGPLRPSWTTDGTAIWAGTGDPIAAYDVATGAVKRTMPAELSVKTAITQELADGSLVGVLPGHGASDYTVGGVALVRPDRPATWLLRGQVEEGLAVTPAGRHALVSRGTPNGVELLDVPLDGSPPTSLAASGVEARQGIALSRDGARVVWSSCREVPQVVSIDTRAHAVRPIPVDMARVSSLAPVADRAEIAVVSARSGRSQPWIVPLARDAVPRPIDIGNATASEIAVSHDGTRFVVSIADHGLAIGSTTGDPALRPLTTVGTDSAPAFVAGGAASDFMGAGTDGAAPSPVDDRVAYLAGTVVTEVVPMISGGRAGGLRPLSPKLASGRYAFLRFSPDGKRVVLVRGQTELLEVDAATGAIVRSFSTATNDQLGVPTYTSAGILAIRVAWQGNLWTATSQMRE